MHVSTFKRRYSSSRSPLCATLDDADNVVQTFDKAQRHLALSPAIGSSSISMSIGHLG